MDFSRVLTEREFIVTAELDPPRGVNTEDVVEKVKYLSDYVDAINFTDSPMARMKMNPVALTHHLKNKFNFKVDFICHLTGRDRNLIGLQSELLGGALLGVKNYLFLTGDKPEYGDHPSSTGVFDCDGTALVKLANQLNGGRDYAGNPLNGPLDITIGAGINPGGNLTVEIEKLKSRIGSGARFIQTQIVYDPGVVINFMERIKTIEALWPVKPRILFGIMPLKNYKMATYIHENVPGVDIPAPVMKAIKKGDERTGIKLAKEFVLNIKDYVDGIHIMPMGRMEVVSELVDAILTEGNRAIL
ncbi:methylenetetrahydrofolate reductase [Halothermothrix orenii]|uniref:methylenetetrahydrofolate reductase n=1 Tax=Halothermothrix orenii TaxID=31909 RepID=UPI0002D8CF8A|nr:methylenetetrahydrofolate reductase [Halothermothrix orenii]